MRPSFAPPSPSRLRWCFRWNYLHDCFKSLVAARAGITDLFKPENLPSINTYDLERFVQLKLTPCEWELIESTLPLLKLLKAVTVDVERDNERASKGVALALSVCAPT